MRDNVLDLHRFKASTADLEELFLVTQKGAVNCLQLWDRSKPATRMGLLTA